MAANQHHTLLNLPAEIRCRIFSYVVEDEQANIREYVGHHRNTEQSELCTPLYKVRPPSLIRVCKEIRQEYLPIYFAQTCFRVYVDIGKAQLPGQTEECAWMSDRAMLDDAAKDWLDSLGTPASAPRIRNLQFRFTRAAGMIVGASFNVAFDAKEQKYRGDFVIDEGWLFANMPVTLWPFSANGTREWPAIIGTPRMAWFWAKRWSEAGIGEWLCWNKVKILVSMLDPTGLEQKVSSRYRLATEAPTAWSDETARVSIDEKAMKMRSQVQPFGLDLPSVGIQRSWPCAGAW